MTNTPELKLYHAQADKNGSALGLSLSPAVYISAGETLDGFIQLRLAAQIGKLSTRQSVPEWDWENAKPLNLTFTDLSELLLVLDGEKQSLNNGLGIRFDGKNGDSTMLTAYLSGKMDDGNIRLVVRTDDADKNWKQTSIILSRDEVVGIASAVKGALTYVAFGDPNA